MLFLLYLYQQYNDTIAICEFRMHYWPKHLYGSQIRSNGKPVLKLLVCFNIQIPALPDTVLVGAIFEIAFIMISHNTVFCFDSKFWQSLNRCKHVNYSCSWNNT